MEHALVALVLPIAALFGVYYVTEFLGSCIEGVARIVRALRGNV